MRVLAVISLLVAAGVAAATRGSLIEIASIRATERRNPLVGSDHARLAGAKLYGRECASCHGTNRQGGKGPVLDQVEVYQATPGALFWILRNGSLRQGMPSFAHLPEGERWQIITFLQTSRSQ